MHRWIFAICLGLCAPALFAQQAPDFQHPLAGCGDDSVSYSVSHAPGNEALVPLEENKAVVYFIELNNLTDKHRFARPTLRHGIDGAWVGATQGFSYVTAAVSTGEHHLCTRWQSHFSRLSDQISLYNFHAEAGKRYYFRVQIDVEGGQDGTGPVSIDLQPVSEDEGVFLVSESTRSLSKVKH